MNNIKQNPLINNIVKTILDNDKFFNTCKISLEQIYADNKIDSKDIPIILNLLVSTYNNHTTIKIDRKDIKEVFILLFIEMIEKLQWSDKIDVNSTIEILSPQIDLLLISINPNISNWCWCSTINGQENP